ncbi:hypothetical protein ET33_27745 [Paenibacillus tyrfis]|uniref:Uncharacterized protein n=1 Tax=Paenibacillus tyrfis TaxID=1501230 RepID=A0A081NUM5_9BACL|nr:hypothetical protein ET33_27745 [Paenibacillus tyrfis]
MAAAVASKAIETGLAGYTEGLDRSLVFVLKIDRTGMNFGVISTAISDAEGDRYRRYQRIART